MPGKNPPTGLTDGPTGPELAALALYLLDGATQVVDTEDVAMKIHELAPGRFSWRKYPAQINLELVRVALSDARKPESGALVAGKGRRGWSLTAMGLTWAQSQGERLLGQDLVTPQTQRTAGSIDEARRQRELGRLRTTEAWRQWSNDQSSLTREAARDLFRIDRYVDGQNQELKVNRLRELLGHDAETLEFIEEAASLILKGDDR